MHTHLLATSLILHATVNTGMPPINIINEHFRLAVGAENIFDAVPDDDGHFVSELLGVDKALTSPFGFNGGLWYVRLAADF